MLCLSLANWKAPTIIAPRVTDSSTENDGFPPDYEARIERVCSEAANEFRLCQGDLLAQLRVCCSYFERGEAEEISQEELIDFLGISTPSVLDRAGYSDFEAQRVMEALVLITYDKNGRPQPPESMPGKSASDETKQSNLNLDE
jgi:hypothetical protein